MCGDGEIVKNMRNLIKKTFIHRNEKMPYLWTRVGVSVLSAIVIILVVLAQFHQYIFLKISHKISGSIINSMVVDITNQERQAVGLGDLKINEALRKAAQAKAQDMAEKSYFAHNSPDGKNPWYWIDQTGYTYKSAGENLAVNFDYSKDVVDAWMNSPTHRANIVKAKYQEIGIGIAEGFYQGRPTVFVVQMFATPKEEMGFGNISLVSINDISTSSTSATTSLSISSTTSVLGASFDTISLYELIFSGKIRNIMLGTIIFLITLVLLLALMNPSGKIIVKIAKMALIPLFILLVLYILLILKSGTAETSFMEF